MSPSEHEPTPESTPVEQPVPTSGLASVERRRGLLRGLSAGAALSGAALPMAALANGSRKSCFHKDDIDRRKCKATVSSMGSPIASAQINDWPESPGKHCSHYQSGGNWPMDGKGRRYCIGKNGSKYYYDDYPAYGNQAATFGHVFGCAGTGGYNDYKIKDLMSSQIDCPQRTWLTACLNATKLGAAFCYSPTEVVALYWDGNRNLAAQTFFKEFQENHMY